ALDLGQQLAVGQDPASAALVERDQRRLVTAPGGDVAVERVHGQVGAAARKPCEGRRLAHLERAIRRTCPVEPRRRLEPEGLRLVEGLTVQVVVALAGFVHRPLPPRRSQYPP